MRRFALASIVLLAAGCGGGGGTSATITVPSGHYAGVWYGPGVVGPSGNSTGTITTGGHASATLIRSSDSATFSTDGTFTSDGKYKGTFTDELGSKDITGTLVLQSSGAGIEWHMKVPGASLYMLMTPVP